MISRNTTLPPTTAESSPQHQRGQIVFYHANGKGTGAALRFELKPRSNRQTGCIFMELANQNSTATGSGHQRTHATFDWESKATVKLSFMDICEFVSVLQMKQGSLGANGKGLYHVNGDKDTLITMRPNTERPGYTIGVSRKDRQGAQLFKGYFQLSPTEATGVEAILSASLFFMAFGPSSSTITHQKTEAER